MLEQRWVKLSKDLLTDENFTYIKAQLAPELSAAPYMFYLAALKLADSDGIFDLEDGIIFSQLMQVGTVKDVWKIANLMQQRHIITRVSRESNKCLISLWEYPTGKSLTAAQRRQKVNDMIEEEKKRRSAIKQFSADDYNVSGATKPIDFTEGNDQKVNDSISLCPKNDKTAQNVDKTNVNDKLCENVDKTEREKETKIDTVKKDTHTQKEAAGLCELPEGSLRPLPDKAAVAGDNETTKTKENTENEKADENNKASETVVSDDIPEEYVDEQKDMAVRDDVFSVVNEFFVKNCQGYKPNQARKPVETIITRVLELSNEKNPPDIVANILCSEFKKLSEKPNQYYQGTPLLPAYMIKDGVWAHLVQNVGQILAGDNKTKKQFYEVAKQYQAEYEKDRESVGDAINNQYVQLGIDPNDPRRFEILMQKKQEENPKETETGDFEIF